MKYKEWLNEWLEVYVMHVFWTAHWRTYDLNLARYWFCKRVYLYKQNMLRQLGKRKICKNFRFAKNRKFNDKTGMTGAKDTWWLRTIEQVGMELCVNMGINDFNAYNQQLKTSVELNDFKAAYKKIVDKIMNTVTTLRFLCSRFFQAFGEIQNGARVTNLQALTRLNIKKILNNSIKLSGILQAKQKVLRLLTYSGV